MPFKTRYYNLEAFRTGDSYSSKVDKRRFTIIDNETAFIADFIGSGLIFGWDVTNNEDGTISISNGMGMINRRVVESFGGFEVTLSNNSIHYLIIESKDGVVGGVSAHSNMVQVTAIDTIAPVPPVGVQKVDSILDYLDSLPVVTDELTSYLKNLMNRSDEDDTLALVPYKEIAFSWSANTEADFSYYKITKGFGSEVIILGTTTELIYADINLESDTNYEYQVIAVDLSGNESDTTEIEISTDIDERIPSAPQFVQVFPGDETLQVVWDNSPTSNVPNYRVEIQELDIDYVAVGNPTVTIVPAETQAEFGSSYVIFENLSLNTNYEATVYSQSKNGTLSVGSSKKVLLKSTPGAGDVNNIEVEFSVSTFENVGVETKVSWRYNRLNPSISNAEKFLVTFIENGNRFSEPIELLNVDESKVTCPDGDNTQGDCYEMDVKYIPYINNNNLEYESLKQYTPYVFLVQTEDINGNISAGAIVRVARTIVSDILPSITNYTIERATNNDIFLEWTNPTESYFSYNRMTINIIDLTTTDVDGTNFIDNKNVGKIKSYVIPSSQFNINFRYTVTITPYDVFIQSGTGEGSEGAGFAQITQFTDSPNILRPSIPTGLKIEAGDKQVSLSWNIDTLNEDIEFYRIYRAEYSTYQRSSNFSVINTIPSSLISFIDYTAVNGTSYTYFVTAIDTHGTESLNPLDDGHISTNAVSASPSASLSLSPPEDLIASYNSNDTDVELSWSVSAGTFDGYEILKSVGNNYSFEIIDQVPVSTLNYIDTDSLLKHDEDYYYIVRKYRDEVSLIVKSSSSLTDNQISIGEVITYNGVSNVSIDLSSVVNLANLLDPLTDLTNESIAVHHHTNDLGIDKRIELRSNVSITDWTTSDYKVYTSQQDVQGATTYFVQISGEINEEYFTTNDIVDTAALRQAQAGESPILFEVVEDKNQLVFDAPLYSQSGTVTPYSEEPSIILELLGISEVDSLLPSVKVKNISASQFGSGRFEFEQMPIINHEGRKAEKLLPIRLPMQTLDNFVYRLAATYEDQDRNNMGTSVAFYDIITTDGEVLLAATSNGVWISENYGNDWEQASTFPVAVRKLYKSLDGDYYAITNYGVYKNNGDSFRTWDLMEGLEYAKSIRDITEDGNGNIYVSTDLGVFKLNSALIPYIEDTWQKMPIFGAKSSESYAIVYDRVHDRGSIPGQGRVLVSNEIGIVQSVDDGLTWNYISDLEAFIKVRDFVIDNGYIFALSDNAIYREQIGENVFVKIADIDSNLTKDMVIFSDQLYITTDNGMKRSVAQDIYTETGISIVATFENLNINNTTVPATTIDLINDNMFIGSDRLLYVMEVNGNNGLQFEQKETVIPSIYINSVLQKLGFYYNNSGTDQNISFDEIRDEDSHVFVSNKYDIYNSEFGGWAYNKYDAKFKIFNNNLMFGESRDEIELDINQFALVILPTYNDNNAHKEGADIYKADLEANLTSLTDETLPEGNDLILLISDTYQNFELFLSQLYDEVKSDFILPSILTDIIVKRDSVSNSGDAIEVEEPVYTAINAARGTSYDTSVNVVDGFFTFGLPFDKHDSITLDIFDVTIKNAGENSHRELEDILEEAYSGPPSYLSQVQQVNLVKMGLFTEKLYPGEQEAINPLVQSKMFIPNSENFYDTLNSTINYDEQEVNNETTLAINYPSSVIYISETETAMVGGKGGVLSINKNTLEINEVNFGTIDSDTLVRGILQTSNGLFILTDDEIFASIDDGVTWSEYNRSGLPNRLYSIGVIANNLIVGAEDGVYIKLSNSEAIDWERVKDSETPVEIIHSSNVLFTVVGVQNEHDTTKIDKKIFITGNGFTYSDTNIGEDLDITDIDRHGFVTTYVSTNQGLYSDNGSFNSLEPTLQSMDLGELIQDGDTINDTTTDDSNKVVIGTSNGSYGLITGDILNIKGDTSLDVVHKILIIDDNEWLFGQDLLKVPFLDYPIRLTTGAPM